MEDQRLSDNFMLSELVKSNTANRLGIDNWPQEDWIIDNLRTVAQKILQPVREHFGVPFAPESGYRCLELNRALRSKDTSQHLKGQAVDFEIAGISNYDIADWMVTLDFDQLILENYTIGIPSSGWIHCSYEDQYTNRHDILTYDAEKGFFNGLQK